MIDGKIFFGQPVKNDLIKYENIRKIATGQGDDYTTGCLLDYNYFKNYDMIIATDLRKQQVLDADPKAIQQINFSASLDQEGNTTMFSNIEEAKEIILITLRYYFISSQHTLYHTFPFHLLFSLYLTLIIGIFCCLNYTSLLLRLIITYLVNAFFF